MNDDVSAFGLTIEAGESVVIGSLCEFRFIRIRNTGHDGGRPRISIVVKAPKALRIWRQFEEFFKDKRLSGGEK